MALIAVITVVNASHSELSDSTRRSRTIFTDGSKSVKIMVILPIVKQKLCGHYA